MRWKKVLLIFIPLLIISTLFPVYMGNTSIEVYKVKVLPGGGFIALPPGRIIGVYTKINIKHAGSFTGDPKKVRSLFKPVDVYVQELYFKGRHLLKYYVPSSGLTNCTRLLASNSDLQNKFEYEAFKLEDEEDVISCDFAKVESANITIVMKRELGIYLTDPYWDVIKRYLHPIVINDEVPLSYVFSYIFSTPEKHSLHVYELTNYTTIANISFASSVYTAFNENIPDAPVLVEVKPKKPSYEKGDGTMMTFSLLFPLLKHKERILNMSYDYYFNLSNINLSCPNRLRLLIYTGHGMERGLTPIRISNTIYIGELPCQFAVEKRVLNYSSLCPSDFSVFYTCLSGVPGGLAEKYAREHGSVALAFTTPVPVHPLMDEAIYIYVKVLRDTWDPETAYLTYLSYFTLKAPNPDWLVLEVNGRKYYTSGWYWYKYAWDVGVYASILYVPSPES